MAAQALLQAASFIHPGLAVGALLTGLIPILLHLVHRRRYRRVAWAAMTFLIAANTRSARRVRLEQWLLLSMRVALIVLLGLALARPIVSMSAPPSLGVSRSHRILVIDDSLSMNARRIDGRTRFERALQTAKNLLDSFPETDAVSVVTVAEPAHAVIAHAAYERRIVRERVSTLRPTQRRADPAGALGLVLEILRSSEAAAANRSVYVLSDLPRRHWLEEDQGKADGVVSAPTPAVTAARQVAEALENPAADLNFVWVGSPQIANVAVTELEVESPLVTVQLPVQLVAEITNFGDSTVRGLTVQLSRDEEIIRRESLPPIEPGRPAVVRVWLEFASAGTHVLEAKLIASAEDDLPADDSRRLSVEVPESIAALLVDGRPEAALLAGQAGYLATALAPRVGTMGEKGWPSEPARRSRFSEQTLVAPKVIGEPELSGEALFEYDVLVLCNVHRLTGGQWARVQRFVSRGGGLLVFGGDLVSVDNYNRYGHADGKGLLPVLLDRPATLPAATGRAPGFQSVDLVHPVVREFETHPESGLFLARVDRYLPARPDLDRAEVILRYTNGAPAMVATAYGQGRVVVCTTTANMDWTNLPGKGDFVSLMLNTVAYLSPRRGVHRNVLVGRVLREPLTAVESSLPLRVTSGDGRAHEGRIVPLDDALTFEFGPVEQSGTISLEVGSTVRSFAVNVDPNESDLAAVSEEELATALDCPFRFIADAKEAAVAPVAAPSSELASLAFYCVLALLFAESLLAMRFGSRRAMDGGT